MTMNFIKLSKVAKDLGITKQTLWRWKWKGDIEFHKIGNLNFIDLDTYHKLLGVKNEKTERIIIYCRVSSSVNKTNLDTQASRVKQYCMAKGYNIHKIIKEYGSGLNDNRRQLTKLLTEQDFTKIVIEHKDRLSRSGFNYIKVLLEFNNIEVEVINNSIDDEENIIQDFISIITSYCAKIYGKRRSRRKTEQLIHELKSN
jgi:predicted site-specific integrase-resolvase